MAEGIEKADDLVLRRYHLFKPCETKKELHQWLKIFLNIDFPDAIVDQDSTASPMDFIWEVYERAKNNDDPEFRRVLYYAARGTFKTLGAAALEVLMILHLNRDVCHMAAIKEQSKKAQSYTKGFFKRRYLRDFIIGNNELSLKMMRYYNPKTGHSLTEKEYEVLDKELQAEHIEDIKTLHEYIEEERYIKVVVCTMSGANSDHCTYLCVDGNTQIQEKGKKKLSSARSIFRRFRGNKIVGRESKIHEEIYTDSITNIEALSLNLKTQKTEFCEVTQVMRRLAKVFEIKTLNHKLICSINHPIYTELGFKQANQLLIDNKICIVENNEVFYENIIEINKLDGLRPVYDFTIEKNHNFITNGILSKNCVDEVDVVTNPAAYKEAKNIPDARDDQLPITCLISTRKTGSGFVQKEINDAPQTGLKVRHWNLIDVTRRCPPNLHRPDLPRVKLYYSDDLLAHTTEEGYHRLRPNEKQGYVEKEGYAGCATCKLFPMCKTRLATEQTSNSSLLKPIPDTIGKFIDHATDLDMAKSQLLCRKTTAVGLIYPRFDATKHIISPYQTYRRVFGESPQGFEEKTFTTNDLIKVIAEHKFQFSAGMDFGDTHLFAYAAGFRDGRRFYFTNYFAANELDPDQMADNSEILKTLEARIYGDPENPMLVRVLRKAGLGMQTWMKKKGSVQGGIQVVRAKMNPIFGGEPELFFVHDIEEVLGEHEMLSHCDQFVEDVSEWRWKLDAAGLPTGTPEENRKDRNDAIRYCIMNEFTNATGIIAPAGTIMHISEPSNDPTGNENDVYHPKYWAKQVIAHELGIGMEDVKLTANKMKVLVKDEGSNSYTNYYDEDSSEDGPKSKGKKGKFVWDID